jgi:glycosyltransferase involved in cell wall biosynthesis
VRLVLVTQTLDPEHAALAQTLDLVHALAERVDGLAVVAREVRTATLPHNVVTRTFDARTRAGRTLAFERSLAASLGGADAILVHMVPTFALLAAPWVRARRVPLLLWYTHWHASRSLRLATLTVDIALSVDTASYPIASSKVRPIGHAIDVERFASAHPGGHRGPLRLLALGRTARWKGFATLLSAFAQALERGLDATLVRSSPPRSAATSGCGAVPRSPRLFHASRFPGFSPPSTPS